MKSETGGGAGETTSSAPRVKSFMVGFISPNRILVDLFIYIY